MTSKEIWNKLCNVHDNRSKANKMVLQSQFFGLKMESDEKMEDYIGRSVSLEEQLKGLGAVIDDTMIAANLVSGLPRQYSSFITSWSATEESSQTMAHLEPRLVAEEQMLARFADVDSTALYSKPYIQPNQPIVHKKLNKQTRDLKNDDQEKSVCRYYKEEGHWIRDCPALKRKQLRQLDQQAPSSSKTEPSTQESSAIIAIVALVEACEDWVLDSGASQHMCANLSLFDNYFVLDNPKPVRFGNNQRGSGIGVGEIKVLSTVNDHETRLLTLKNVLHVPEICHKLL